MEPGDIGYGEFMREMMFADNLTGPDLYSSENRGKILRPRNNDIIAEFLGDGPRSVEAYKTNTYYGELLAWTIKCLTAAPVWKTESVYGYRDEKPIFWDIQTDYKKSESCLINGQLLIEKEGIRLVMTVVASRGFVQVEAGEEHQEQAKKLVRDIADFLKEHNLYKGKKISFNGKISFLNAGRRDWDSIILDPVLKKEIRLNTVGFLRNWSRLEKYCVPPKRGIILAGDPGVGKTIICKALMTEADKITCISTSAYATFSEGYISDLYSLAQDLSPSMVFIEDIDFIGRERNDFFHGTAPLIALLAEMDGIAEKTAIVTVATSNCFETLDKALSERPSRFDRVFRINRPNFEQRAELIKRLSEKISLSEDLQEHIVRKTDGFTPAQLVAVLLGMVISRSEPGEESKQFEPSDADLAISWLNAQKRRPMGFGGSNN